MVDLSGGTEGGPYEHKFDNWIFVGPAILVILLVGTREHLPLTFVILWILICTPILCKTAPHCIMSLLSFLSFLVPVLVIGFFASKLIQSLKEKERKREEKKKLKQQKKDGSAGLGVTAAALKKKK